MLETDLRFFARQADVSPCGKTKEGEGRSRSAVLFSLYHSAPGRPFPPGNPMMPSARTSKIRKERWSPRFGQVYNEFKV